MIHIDDYIKTAFDAVSTVVDRVYSDRPSAVSDKVSVYAVVDCDSPIRNREIDYYGDYNDYETTVHIDLFVRDRQSSSATNQRDIPTMADALRRLQGLFPIVNEENGILICRPNVRLTSSDGDGWHYSIITARLTTNI